MAPIKRKADPTPSVSHHNTKKIKQEKVAGQPQSRANGVQAVPIRQKKSKSKIAETESDSEPILEDSDDDDLTGNSQSGEDDGVSWPSEDENMHDVESGDEDEVMEDDDDDGGAKLNADRGKLIDGTEQGNAGSNSRESHAKQKLLAAERRAAKPNADLVARSKKLWERLRRKSHVPLEERKKLVSELFDIVTGRVKDFVFKHDSVRVIQTALKYANIDQRKIIATELKGEYKTLSESKYAKFLVGKILVQNDKDVRDFVVPEFYGHVRKLIKHPEASWILDDIYRGSASPTQKAVLLREWYGAEYSVFKTDQAKGTTADLRQILAATPEKKKPIMEALHNLINAMVQKKTTAFTMLHDAMYEYYTCLQQGSEEANEFIELLKIDEEGDLLKNLAFTKSGAQLICQVLAHANAKDRKLILRAFKGAISQMAYDPNAHKVVLTALDVIDDTVLTSKSVVSELIGRGPETNNKQEELVNMIENLNARATLLYTFCGKSKTIMSLEDIDMLNDIHRIRAETSKKAPELRRKELLVSLSPPILDLIASHTRDLVASSFGCQFIAEAILGAEGDQMAALQSILDLLQGNDKDQALFLNPAASRMLKALVQGGHYDPKTKSIKTCEPPLDFHSMFYKTIRSDIIEWATGENSFIVVGLIEAPGFPNVAEVKTTLSAHRARLEKAAGPLPEPSTLSKKKKKAKKGGKVDEATEVVRNMGARMLIKKLDNDG